MVELARRHGDGSLFMSAISESQAIPRKYLHSLLTVLRAAGLVRSLRGSRGGYMLARDPAAITAADVIIALEGPVVLVDCAGRVPHCTLYGSCPTAALWQDLGKMISRRLAEVTLQDLVEEWVADASEDSALPEADRLTRDAR